MTQIICKACGESFDTAENVALAKVGLVGGILIGAGLGGGIGIAGSFGGIGGTIPLAIVGGVIGWLIFKKLYTCPHCHKKIIL